MANSADRLFGGLPAVFCQRDDSSDLERLLTALGLYFFGGDVGGNEPPGLEEYVEHIPALFAPMGQEPGAPAAECTPDRFVHWLADWLAFTPHALFPPDRLRHIIAGIVPLYARRGTKHYLERLLRLCFDDDIARFEINDRPLEGFTIGASIIGTNTRLSIGRPFTFKVLVDLGHGAGASTPDGRDALRQRVRAVIDFAKPAHTVYELEWRYGLQDSGQDHASA